MNIGRKIFYDTQTGEKIFDTGERSGDVIDLTADEWVERITVLKERTLESFGVLDLAYGEYAQDFLECNGVKVDVTDPAAPKLLFTYPDPAQPEDPPVYQKPLSEEVTAIKTENAALRRQMAQQNADFTAFQDFYFDKNPEQA